MTTQLTALGNRFQFNGMLLRNITDGLTEDDWSGKP